MLKKVISSSKHFIEYDIWKQKGKFLILFLLTGLYFGVINYYIADNKGIITSIESLKYLGGIYVNIPSENLDGVKWFIGIFGISIGFWIIYWLYGKVKNFLTLIKFLVIFLLSLFLYFSFGNDLIFNFRFVSFLPVLVGLAIIFGIYALHFLLSIKAFISSRYSGDDSGNDTDKALEFGKGETIENIKKMQDLGYDSIAKNLAKRLKEEFKKDTSPEVIGIEGEWGSGKSSFINLVKYYVHNEEKALLPLPKFIRELDINKKWDLHFSWDRNQLYDFFEQKFWSEIPPTFLDFNPWYFESTTNLLDSFFRSLSEHIEEKYHIDTGSTFSKFARSIGNVSEYEVFGVKLKRSDTPSSPDYEHQRNNLNQILDSLDNPIIIIIDDLDRVNLEQCKQIFQLIYLCSDLRNVHFLVSYDSEKFNSIDVPTFKTISKEENKGDYNEYRVEPIQRYIQKIIHSKILITPELRGLKKYIEIELRRVFQEIDEIDYPEKNSIFERAMNKMYAPKIFEIYSTFLSTPRSVKRLVLSIKGFMRREDYHKYLINTDTSLALILKIGIIFLNYNGLFRKIINEVSLVDEMNKLDTKDYSAADDIVFYPLEIISLFESVEEQRLKRLDEYCRNILNVEESKIIRDIFSSDTIGSKLQARDLKIAIDLFLIKTNTSLLKGKGFLQHISGTVKELMYLEQFSYDAFLYYSNNLGDDLSKFFKNIEESIFYQNQNQKVKNIINAKFIGENHIFIVDRVIGYFRDHIRDMNEIPQIWVEKLYQQLFTELKSSDFPVSVQSEKFSDTLMGHISDNIGLSVYSLIFWIEKQRGKGMPQIDAQGVIRELFDNTKLFENWEIFGVSYLLRLWSALNESKYSSLISEDTKTWIARFIYEVFEKYYIIPRKSFLTGNYTIDRYWINFAKYQFMSEMEMGNILLSDSGEEKIGEKIRKYFQDVVYADSIFSDIGKLFGYLVVMSYSYSDEFSGTYLYYSGESDWNANPFMKEILIHFQTSIETYVQSNPEEELEVNARYDGYNPKPYKISEIWDHLKKVTKLDNPPAE